MRNDGAKERAFMALLAAAYAVGLAALAVVN
jgi:hypothetical protein